MDQQFNFLKSGAPKNFWFRLFMVPNHHTFLTPSRNLPDTADTFQTPSRLLLEYPMTMTYSLFESSYTFSFVFNGSDGCVGGWFLRKIKPLYGQTCKHNLQELK